MTLELKRTAPWPVSRPSGTLPLGDTFDPSAQRGPVESPPVPHSVGDWVLEEQIGKGGSADVYSAHDFWDPLKTAAIKLPREAQTFEPELAALERVQSPHVVQLLGSGGGETLWIATELLDGPTLTQRVKAEEGLGLAGGLEFIRDGTAALQALQEAGVVHRDLKPDNFIFDGGHVLIDFDTATVRGGKSFDRPGYVRVSLPYVAPERLVGRSQVDHRADVFGLAATAYSAIFNQQAFPARELTSALPPPVRPSALGLPVSMDDVFAVAFEPNPDNRFSSALEFQAAAEAAAGGEVDAELHRRAAGQVWAL